MPYSAKILADSISPEGDRLTTIEITFPRFCLAELNTHRVFSRNSASSRAIPVEKRIAAIEADPFIPEQFGKNQKGMQASEILAGEEMIKARIAWQLACADAIKHARILSTLGVHKQLANRLIEPFAWNTAIISATEWDNFWALRCHPDAQPEFRRAAEMMQDVFNASKPTPLFYGDWHLPLVPDLHDLLVDYTLEQICKISIGRCARVSYLTHDGKRDSKADLKLFDRLASSGHMSPLEHVATPMPSKFYGNFKGWLQFRKTVPNESNFAKVLEAQAVSR
jgi:thymidylate synthase ThyX